MPIEIRDLGGGIGSIIIARGIVTDEEFVKAFKKHLKQKKEKFIKYRYTLLDWTAVSIIAVTRKGVELVANYCINSSTVNPDVVIAQVADNDLVFGLARMWEMLSDTTKWEIMVFRNREEAEDWIKKRVEEKYGIEDVTFD
jgi:hypothetical protein